MRTPDPLPRLYDQQTRILAQIESATALLRLDPLVARAPLARARWTLARMLREYQLFKHREIFDPAIAGGDEREVAAACDLRASCIAAGDAFTAYVARWSSLDIAALWDSYRPAMRRMAGELRTHLVRERAQVERLLAPAPSGRVPATHPSIRTPARPPSRLPAPLQGPDPIKPQIAPPA